VRLAKVTPRQKPVQPDNDPAIRKITARQLTVLLYHFYITVDAPSIGYEDADITASAFQADLDQELDISTVNLEKLLWHLTMAYEGNMYWNPAGEDYEFFIKGLLQKKETFDRLMCLILNKKGTNFYGE